MPSEELANYAVTENNSRGRRFPEKPHPYRTDFERDRDRIIHCAAFRRLEGKTQVFMPGLDDYYRTRLTHSIEVAQIGRTIAKALKVNENLTEAICLAHDLGHPPFGHSGEQVLNDLMGQFGGFEHNRQTLRIVDLLEHPYPNFAGLNLMYETRLGLARHHGPYDKPHADEFTEQNCSLEGQLADIADRIAYNCHDIEDALRAQFIDADQMKDITLFAEARQRINAPHIDDTFVLRTRTAKAIIDNLASDVITTSSSNITQAAVKTVGQVCRCQKLIVLSEQSEQKLVEFERFLFENVYHHRFLLEMRQKVEQWLEKLFRTFENRPQLMPAYFQKLVEKEGLQRTVCDYIAGMTDRFCLKTLAEF